MCVRVSQAVLAAHGAAYLEVVDKRHQAMLGIIHGALSGQGFLQRQDGVPRRKVGVADLQCQGTQGVSMTCDDCRLSAVMLVRTSSTCTSERRTSVMLRYLSGRLVVVVPCKALQSRTKHNIMNTSTVSRGHGGTGTGDVRSTTKLD